MARLLGSARRQWIGIRKRNGNRGRGKIDQAVDSLLGFEVGEEGFNLFSIGEGLHEDSPARIDPRHPTAVNRCEAATLASAACNRKCRGTLRP